MTRQLRLDWPASPDFTSESFVDCSATEEARSVLARWRDWPGRTMVLVGPPGAGKSHLAAIWAGEAGAGAAVAEDADAQYDERALFSMLERAASGELDALLLTARVRPAEWEAALPDLASRLRAVSYVEIGAPDEAALSQILRKLLRDRHLRADDRVIEYVLKRIERSVAAARDAADALDRASGESGRRVTIPLAKRALAGQDEGISA